MPTSTDKRATGESQYFNLFALRRLYNEENAGRGKEGVKSRYDMHPTIRHQTFLALIQSVPVGRGQYGSSVVELSLRIMLALLGKVPIEAVAEELAVALKERSTVVTNLIKMAKLISGMSEKTE